MHKKLEEILKETASDLAERKKKVPPAALAALLPLEPPRAFEKGLMHPKNGTFAVIAEVKLASPSAGVLGSAEQLIERVRAYAQGGADALSIVTEKHFFNGDPDFIQKAKEVVPLPVLQKDFILDVYQLSEARHAGADAILLIARIVPPGKLTELVSEAYRLGLTPVVEVHDEHDLAEALLTEARILAVNARDLDTFVVDVEKASRLLRVIPDTFLKLGFSGVESAIEARCYTDAGANGILVGTALMKAQDTKNFIHELSI